jgi:hypothetical protein
MFLECLILKKSVFFFETSVAFYKSTQRDIPEDLDLQQHRCETPSILHSTLALLSSELLLTEGQTDEAWGHTKEMMLFRISGSIEKGRCFYCFNFQRVIDMKAIGICG